MTQLPKIPKLCYFVKNGEVTTEDRLAALAFGVPVVFRNSTVVIDDSEKFDGVIGDIPEAYAKYPLADEVIEQYKQTLAQAKEAFNELVDATAKQQQKALEEAEAKAAAELEAKAKEAEQKQNPAAADGWKANN